MVLLRSSGSSLSPYNKSCTRVSLERLVEIRNGCSSFSEEISSLGYRLLVGGGGETLHTPGGTGLPWEAN